MRIIGLILLGALLLACQTPTDDTKANAGPPTTGGSLATAEFPDPTYVPPGPASIRPAAADPSDLAPGDPAPSVLNPAASLAPPPPPPRSILTAPFTPTPGTGLAPGGTLAPTPVSRPDPRGANVTSVTVSGGPGSYKFSVTVQSPDTGCDQYADWWEVLSPEGALIYRRVLLHSHRGEQPFTRSGGPVKIGPDDQVIVRAHMNTTAYGGIALAGSPALGFGPADLGPDFAAQLETGKPLPSGCAG